MTKHRCEVAVIGGGSGGAVMASRLVQAGIDTILIEAGPDYGPRSAGRWPDEILDAAALATSHDWGYGSGPVTGREPWSFERARIMGGCSSHNGAIAAVGHASDYDAWGLPLWATDELRPVFDSVLDTMKVRAYQPDEAGPFHGRCLEAARALWPIASDLCELDANTSFGLEMVNVIDGVRWNTSFAYLDQVRSLNNLEILDRVRVATVEHHETGATVHGHRSDTHGNDTKERIDADLVVIAAGVYGTPSILQRSGVGDPAHLEAVGVPVVLDQPLVGTNLHDHPMINLARDLGAEMRAVVNAASEAGFVPEEQTLGKAASSLSTDGVFDLHLFPVCGSTQTQLTGGQALFEVACMTPRSRGHLRIQGVDPDLDPLIDHRYLTDPDDHDLRVLREGLQMVEDLANQPILADVLRPAAPRDLSDEAIRRDVLHYYHPVGTTPMGKDETMSVCDERGRLHGLPHLMVADASLMPQIPRANTNIPVIMMAERLADLLVGAR